jgi:4-carboxymuconolactone decarboxylase
MTRDKPVSGRIGTIVMDDYKEHLRRLALHDDAFVGLLTCEESTAISSALDPKTVVLVRLAATIAADAAPPSFQHAVAHALAAGATFDEIVATLEAVTPVSGAARVVQCAPKLALALGYDVEAALDELDP